MTRPRLITSCAIERNGVEKPRLLFYEGILSKILKNASCLSELLVGRQIKVTNNGNDEGVLKP